MTSASHDWTKGNFGKTHSVYDLRSGLPGWVYVLSTTNSWKQGLSFKQICVQKWCDYVGTESLSIVWQSRWGTFRPIPLAQMYG